MAKTINTGIAGLFTPTEAAEPAQPTEKKTRKKRTQKRIRPSKEYLESHRPQPRISRDGETLTSGLRKGYTRCTLIAEKATVDKIREIAYLERCQLLEVVQRALAAEVERYEAEHGEVIPPSKAKR